MADGVISTMHFAGTFELAQEFAGRTGPSLSGLSFGRGQESGQIRSLEVLLVGGGIQNHRVRFILL